MIKRLGPVLILVGLLGAGCGEAAAPPSAPATPTEVLLVNTPPPAQAGTPTAPTGGERRPGWIMGRAADAAGQPLPNTLVAIRSGSVSMGSEAYYEAETDAEGRYAQQVPGTHYAITAYARLTYKTRNYKLWLHPVNGVETPNEDVRGGLVKDFVLRLAGPRPSAKDAPDAPGSYYGGEIDLGDDAGFRFAYTRGPLNPPPYPAGAIIRLELTPDGPLFDGSPASVLTYDFTPEKLAFAVLRDVPLGDYTARATLVQADGGTAPLYVASRIADGTFGGPAIQDAAPVVFTPERMSGFGPSLVKLHVLRQKEDGAP